MLAAMPFPEEFGGFRRLPKALTPARASEPGGDAHNPEFQGSGRAERQWELTVAACRVPGLLRRLSWQRVMAVAAGAPELAYLAGRPHVSAMCTRLSGLCDMTDFLHPGRGMPGRGRPLPLAVAGRCAARAKRGRVAVHALTERHKKRGRRRSAGPS